LCDDDRSSDSQNAEFSPSPHSSDEEKVVNAPKSQEDSQRHPRFKAARSAFRAAGAGAKDQVNSIPITYCKEGHRVINLYKVPHGNQKSREKLRCAWCKEALGQETAAFNCRCEIYFACEPCIRKGHTFPPPPKCRLCNASCRSKIAHGARQCAVPSCPSSKIAPRNSAWHCSNKDCEFTACTNCLKGNIDESSHPPSTTACSKTSSATTAAADANAPNSGNPSTHAGPSGESRP